MACILVNTGVLPQDPDIFIKDLSEIGITVIMFALWFEKNSSDFVRSVKRSWGIASVDSPRYAIPAWPGQNTVAAGLTHSNM